MSVDEGCIPHAISIWQDHIDVCVRAGKALRLQWKSAMTLRGVEDGSEGPSAADVEEANALVDEACQLAAAGELDFPTDYTPHSFASSSSAASLQARGPALPADDATVERNVMLLLSLLVKTIANLSRSLSNLVPDSQQKQQSAESDALFLNPLEKHAFTSLLIDVLDTQLLPNLFSFVVAPVPSLLTQREAARAAMAIIVAFAAGGSPQGGLSCLTTRIVAPDGWDDLAEAHSLRDAVEVAIVNGGRSSFGTTDSDGEELLALHTLHTLVELSFVLVSVSESVAASFLCESETAIDDFVRIGEKCLNFSSEALNDAESAAACHIHQLSLLGYLLSLFDVLCCRIDDACHILISARVPTLALKVISIPCRGVGFFDRRATHMNIKMDEASPAASAGIASSQGLALQLLTRLTRLCFPSFGPSLLVDPSGDSDSVCAEQPSALRATISNVILTSPFCEVVEAALVWLDLCVRKLGTHVVGMTIASSPTGDTAISSDRQLATAFMRSMVDQYSILKALQEIIQNYLTTPATTPQSDIAARAKCSAAAVVCLQGILLYSPWEIQTPRRFALEQKTFCGLLVTFLRRHRMQITDIRNALIGLARDPSGTAVNSRLEAHLVANTYSALSLGIICFFSQAGREAIAALLCNQSVMGSGSSSVAPQRVSQTLVNLWTDIEMYLSVASSQCASGSMPILSAWHLDDEHGARIVESDARREWLRYQPLETLPIPPSAIDIAGAVASQLSRDPVGHFLMHVPQCGATYRKQNADGGHAACVSASMALHLDNIGGAEALVNVQAHCDRRQDAHESSSAIIYAALHLMFRKATSEVHRSLRRADPFGVPSHPVALAPEQTVPSEVLHGSNNLPLPQKPHCASTSSVVPSTSFADSMKLIVTLAHHYVGNVEKLRQLETEVAKSKMNESNAAGIFLRLKPTMLANESNLSKMKNQTFGVTDTQGPSMRTLLSACGADRKRDGVLFSATAQQTRCWSVRDLRPCDLIDVAVPLVHAAEPRGEEERDDILRPSLQGFDIGLIVGGLAALQNHIKAHLVVLHEALEKCPMQFHTRRCLLSDLYKNVYPKILLIVRSLLWVILGGQSAGTAPMKTKSVHNLEAAKALFMFVVGEQRRTMISASNIIEVHDLIRANFGAAK